MDKTVVRAYQQAMEEVPELVQEETPLRLFFANGTKIIPSVRPNGWLCDENVANNLLFDKERWAIAHMIGTGKGALSTGIRRTVARRK